jgi:hypothetical protein
VTASVTIEDPISWRVIIRIEKQTMSQWATVQRPGFKEEV